MEMGPRARAKLHGLEEQRPKKEKRKEKNPGTHTHTPLVVAVIYSKMFVITVEEDITKVMLFIL